MRVFIHSLFGSAISLCVGAEVTGADPYFPYSWVEITVALTVGWSIAAAIMHRQKIAATWSDRVLPAFSESARFRNLAPQIRSVLDSLLEDNRNPKKVIDLRMSPGTTAQVKMLLYRFDQLGIPSPSGREIVEWIDWLPYMVSLSEDGDLKTARRTNPRDRTLKRFRFHDRTGTKT